MLSVDQSVIYQIINFVVLVFLLNFVLYKPLRSIINKRREKVSDLENNISFSEKKINDIDRQFADRMKEAKAVGFKKKEMMIENAEIEEKEIVQSINEKAQEDLSQLKEKIKTDTEKVRLKLQEDIDSFAEVIGQKLLGRVIS